MSNLIKHDGKRKYLPIGYMGFLARYENENTQKIVNHNIKNFAEFLRANNILVEKVDQNIINIYLLSLRNRGLKNATYNLNVSNIKKFLEHFGKTGFEFKTERAEAYGNTKLVSEQGFKNVMQYLDTKRATDGNKQTKYLRDYILFNILYLTGLRKNEVMSLKHGDIILEGGEYVYQARLKRGKEIKKQFPLSLIESIKALKQAEGKADTDYIFTSIYTDKGQKLSNRALNKMLNFYYQKVNNTIENVTIHSIRNLSGFKVFQITKDIMKTQAHLNHAHLNTTQIYLDKLQSKKIDYYNEMSGALI